MVDKIYVLFGCKGKWCKFVEECVDGVGNHIECALCIWLVKNEDTKVFIAESRNFVFG